MLKSMSALQDVVIDENLNHAEEDEGCVAEVLSTFATEATLNEKQVTMATCMYVCGSIISMFNLIDLSVF